MLTDLARSWGRRLFDPIAGALGRLGLSPNAVTVLGFALTAAVALVLACGKTRLAGVLLIFTLATDALDGAVARSTGKVTRFGAFLDSTLDRWAEVLLFAAVVWQSLKGGEDTLVILAVAALATSLLVSYTRARAEGVGLPCREGLLTRFERMVILVGGLILNQLFWALLLIAVLAGITAIQRIWITWRLDRALPD